MVHPALRPRRRRALFVVAVGLSLVAGCGKSTDTAGAAKLAKQACGVFEQLKPPTGTGQQAQIDYAKESYIRFVQAAELASRAVAKDSRWRTLQSAAQDEAAAFEVIVKAADPHTSANVNSATVSNAVKESNTARPVFLAQCAIAVPGFLTRNGATSSPSATTGT